MLSARNVRTIKSSVTNTDNTLSNSYDSTYRRKAVLKRLNSKFNSQELEEKPFPAGFTKLAALFRGRFIRRTLQTRHVVFIVLSIKDPNPENNVEELFNALRYCMLRFHEVVFDSSFSYKVALIKEDEDNNVAVGCEFHALYEKLSKMCTSKDPDNKKYTFKKVECKQNDDDLALSTSSGMKRIIGRRIDEEESSIDLRATWSLDSCTLTSTRLEIDDDYASGLKSSSV